MAASHESNSVSPIERMLVDPTVQQGLANAFSELDAEYEKYNTSHETPLTRLGPMMVTKSGIIIEAAKKTADNVYENNNDDADDYLVFAFRLSELSDPDFSIQPLALIDKKDTQYRGSGTAIKLTIGESSYGVDEPAPERPEWLPEIITAPNLSDPIMYDSFKAAAGDDREKNKQWRDYAISLSKWQDSNTLTIHRFNDATYTITEFMGQDVEPLSRVRSRLGIELPTVQTDAVKVEAVEPSDSPSIDPESALNDELEKPTSMKRSLGRLPFKKKL